MTVKDMVVGLRYPGAGRTQGVGPGLDDGQVGEGDEPVLVGVHPSRVLDSVAVASVRVSVIGILEMVRVAPVENFS